MWISFTAIAPHWEREQAWIKFSPPFLSCFYSFWERKAEDDREEGFVHAGIWKFMFIRHAWVHSSWLFTLSWEWFIITLYLMGPHLAFFTYDPMNFYMSASNECIKYRFIIGLSVDSFLFLCSSDSLADYFSLLWLQLTLVSFTYKGINHHSLAKTLLTPWRTPQNWQVSKIQRIKMASHFLLRNPSLTCGNA